MSLLNRSRRQEAFTIDKRNWQQTPFLPPSRAFSNFFSKRQYTERTNSHVSHASIDKINLNRLAYRNTEQQYEMEIYDLYPTGLAVMLNQDDSQAKKQAHQYINPVFGAVNVARLANAGREQEIQKKAKDEYAFEAPTKDANRDVLGAFIRISSSKQNLLKQLKKQNKRLKKILSDPNKTLAEKAKAWQQLLQGIRVNGMFLRLKPTATSKRGQLVLSKISKKEKIALQKQIYFYSRSHHTGIKNTRIARLQKSLERAS